MSANITPNPLEVCCIGKNRCIPNRSIETKWYTLASNPSASNTICHYCKLNGCLSEEEIEQYFGKSPVICNCPNYRQHPSLDYPACDECSVDIARSIATKDCSICKTITFGDVCVICANVYNLCSYCGIFLGNSNVVDAKEEPDNSYTSYCSII